MDLVATSSYSIALVLLITWLLLFAVVLQYYAVV
jgi:hypothetical protein